MPIGKTGHRRVETAILGFTPVRKCTPCVCLRSKVVLKKFWSGQPLVSDQVMYEFHLGDYRRTDDEGVGVWYAHGAIETVDDKGHGNPRVKDLLKCRNSVRIRINAPAKTP